MRPSSFLGACDGTQLGGTAGLCPRHLWLQTTRPHRCRLQVLAAKRVKGPKTGPSSSGGSGKKGSSGGGSPPSYKSPGQVKEG